MPRILIRLGVPAGGVELAVIFDEPVRWQSLPIYLKAKRGSPEYGLRHDMNRADGVCVKCESSVLLKNGEFLPETSMRDHQ